MVQPQLWIQSCLPFTQSVCQLPSADPQSPSSTSVVSHSAWLPINGLTAQESSVAISPGSRICWSFLVPHHPEAAHFTEWKNGAVTSEIKHRLAAILQGPGSVPKRLVRLSVTVHYIALISPWPGFTSLSVKGGHGYGSTLYHQCYS